MKRVRSTAISNNRHGFRGVEWDSARKLYRARIEPANGKRGRWLGRHVTAANAALAYDSAAREIYGAEAYLNFPEQGEMATEMTKRADGFCPKEHNLSEHGYTRPDGRGVNCRKCNAEAANRSYQKRATEMKDADH